MANTIIVATQCFPPDVGGIEALMGQLAEQVAGRGFRVVVFADAAKGAGQLASGTHLTEADVVRSGGPKLFRRHLKAREISRQLKAMHLDVAGVICDSWKSLELLRVPHGVPVIALAHGMEFPPDATASKRRRIAAAFNKADAIVASSAYAAGLAQPFLDAALTELVVINPPILDQPQPTDHARSEIARIAGDRLVIAGLGRLEPRKGFDQVIRAMSAVCAAVPDSVFLLAGGGHDRARLEALAARAGMSAGVEFLGRVDDDLKAALLSRAEVFAMPVRREGASVEGFGIVYLEAAWYGVPAIAGREGGASDAVVHGETGLVIDGGDGDAVRDAMIRLATDERLRHRLGDGAKTRARTACLWAQRVDDYLVQMNARPNREAAQQ